MESTDRYRVVINHEEQYEIWPVRESVPKNWRDTGKVGTGEECLRYVEKVWDKIQESDRERLRRVIGKD